MSSLSPESSWYKSFYARLILCLVFAGALAHVIYSIGSYHWTSGDEGWHYKYSLRYFETGELSREIYHNFNSTTPAILLNVFAVKIYNSLSGDGEFNSKVARSVHVIWFIILVFGTWFASKKLGGSNVAWWATFLLLLDPNINAHSSVIGSDIPFLAMSVWILYAIFRYLDTSSLFSAMFIGVLYGLAFCTKYSATFYALPIALALLFTIIRFYREQKDEKLGIKLKIGGFGRIALHGFIILVLASIIVNIAYSFDGTLQPISSHFWHTSGLKYLSENFGTIRTLWPIPFLSGFDHQISAERARAWNVVVMGQSFANGVWYYFLLAWVVKTTIGVVILTLIILFRSNKIVTSWRNYSFPWLLVFISWLSFFCYFSFIFRTQVGYRYAYPCLPLAYILMAGFISWTWSRQIQAKLAIALLLVAAYEVIPYIGNGISFTNSLVVEKKNAYKLLADSNIDWFQNYSKGQEEAHKLLGDYAYNPAHILEGNNVVTLNLLTGVMYNFNQFAWLRKNLEPVDHFQHTLLWYFISKDRFRQFLNEERTFLEPEKVSSMCGTDYNYRKLNEYVNPLKLEGGEKNVFLYTGCLEVLSESVFEVKVKTGSSIISNYPSEHNCKGQIIYGGQSVWFVFKPGMHPICARVNASAEIEYIQHSGEAKFALRRK